MERIITRFVTALRQRGIRVSPGESIDAVHALALGGVEGREAVRALLRLTLVKNANDLPAYEEVFDRFFSNSQPIPQGLVAADLLSAMIHIVEGEQLKADIPDKHGDDGPTLTVDEEVGAEDLKDLLGLEESDDDGGGPEIQVQLDGYRGKIEAPKPSDYYMQGPPTVAFHQQGDQKTVPFTAEELADMQEVVSRMIVRLRKDVRRMKEKQNRGKLHVIRTIQKNYRHDMVPFLLSLRRKLREKPRLVVLCDVSFSVSHASRFMLLLLHTLHNRLMDVRSFIFNKELAEITELLRNMPVNALLETIDRGEIVNLDDNSDFGNVFLIFKKKHLENMRGKPAVIILGDGRNNYHEANDWALEEIREKAGYMLWLTPEERDTWSRGDCLMELYGSYCDRVEVVRDVNELSLMVEDLFRNLCTDQPRRLARDLLKARAEEPLDYRDYYTRGGSGQPPALDPQGRSHW
ncbi:MAG: VWA domain-containing protein [Geobacteraceae bacterium]|nr:VWA domain-containing protein [Geobacteraceae bacterium]